MTKVFAKTPAPDAIIKPNCSSSDNHDGLMVRGIDATNKDMMGFPVLYFLYRHGAARNRSVGYQESASQRRMV